MSLLLESLKGIKDIEIYSHMEYRFKFFSPLLRIVAHSYNSGIQEAEAEIMPA